MTNITVFIRAVATKRMANTFADIARFINRKNEIRKDIETAIIPSWIFPELFLETRFPFPSGPISTGSGSSC